MPRYDVECPGCGVYERISTVGARGLPCETCGNNVTVLITSSTRSKGFEPMFDNGLGENITGIGDRKKIMRENKLDYRDHPSPGEASARRDKMRERERAQERR